MKINTDLQNTYQDPRSVLSQKHSSALVCHVLLHICEHSGHEPGGVLRLKLALVCSSNSRHLPGHA